MRAACLVCGGALAAGFIFMGPAGAHATATVEMVSDTTHVVEVVAWRPNHEVFLLFTDLTGRMVPEKDVFKIREENGADRTRFVLDGKGTVGTYPDEYKGPRWGKVNTGKALLGAGAMLGFCLVAAATVLYLGLRNAD